MNINIITKKKGTKKVIVAQLERSTVHFNAI